MNGPSQSSPAWRGMLVGLLLTAAGLFGFYLLLRALGWSFSGVS